MKEFIKGNHYRDWYESDFVFLGCAHLHSTCDNCDRKRSLLYHFEGYEIHPNETKTPENLYLGSECAKEMKPC